MSGLSAEIITDPERLAEIAPQWRALWRTRPAALPFLTPAWLLPWWRHFSPGALFTIAAWSNGRLVGLAPSYIEDGPLGRRILPLGISLSDHLDILVEPSREKEGLNALSAAAFSRRELWDLWELENLLPDAQAFRLPLPAGCQEEIYSQTACPFLAFKEDSADPVGQLPLKKRRNIQLARNRCERRGAVQIARLKGPDTLHALEHLIRLHQTRWEKREEAGVLASGAVRRFQRDAVPALEESDLLRLYALSIDDLIVAVYYVLVHGRRAYLYLTGFDPDFTFESPGVALLAHAIEQAFTEGCREFDFLRGQEPYKYGWGAVDRWNAKRSIRQLAHD